MKRFDTRSKNILYWFYRVLNPIIDPLKLCLGPVYYLRFARDYVKYAKLSGELASAANLFPILNENSSFTEFDYHYYYQQLWAFENILLHMPATHLDVGSSYVLSGYISKIVPTEFLDIRPIPVGSKTLTITKADVLNFSNTELKYPSISCLHVVEHIGLGRYGDELDPDGMRKACYALSNLLSNDGFLYFSTPLAEKGAMYFNAHRVSTYETVMSYFPSLKLTSFGLVRDDGSYIEEAQPSDLAGQYYSCGLFVFTKTA